MTLITLRDALEQNLESVEELEGSDGEMYFITLRNLAAAHMYSDDFEAAAPMLETVVNGEIDLPDEQIDIQGVKGMLAVCYANLGRKEEAIESLEEVLRLRKETLGEDHPDCLETANNLAVELANNGEHERAAEQQKFILEQSINIHGDEHPITLRCMNNLARTFTRLGEFEEATPLYRETYRLCQLKLGERHVNTVSVGQALANSLLELNEIDEAIPLLEKARQPMLDALGPSHGRVMLLLDSLGKAYEDKNDLAKSIDAYQELLLGFDGEASDAGSEHSVRATVVRLMIANDQAEQAEALAVAFQEVVNASEAASDFSKSLACLTLGLAKVHLTKLDEASESLEYVLARRGRLTKFSDDEKAVTRQVIESLQRQLRDIDSDSTLLDPDEWGSVLEAM